MNALITVSLCLFGLTLAAEGKSTRKTRQILHPIAPLVHGSHNVYSLTHQPHFLPFVHNVILPHSSFHSTGPHVFQDNNLGHHTFSSHYYQHPRGFPQAGFPSGRQNGFQSEALARREQSDQYDSNMSSRSSFQQQSSEPSYEPFNTPSQGSNEGQSFRSGSPVNQNFRGPSEQTSPNFGQSQSSSEPSGLSAYRTSPGPSLNSQPAQNEQQTRAFFPGSFHQQTSSQSQATQQAPVVPILSQSAEIRADGSYNFGFQTADGIQRTEIGGMRPAFYRNEDVSYQGSENQRP